MNNHKLSKQKKAGFEPVPTACLHEMTDDERGVMVELLMSDENRIEFEGFMSQLTLTRDLIGRDDEGEYIDLEINCFWVGFCIGKFKQELHARSVKDSDTITENSNDDLRHMFNDSCILKPK